MYLTSPLRTKQGLVVHLKCEYNQDTINFQTYCMVGPVVASLALSSHLLNIYIYINIYRLKTFAADSWSLPIWVRIFVRTRFYCKHGMECSLFVLLIFFASSHALSLGGSKQINKTKNASFYIHSGNESFKLVMLGDNLPCTIHHQPMTIIIIKIYSVLKKKLSLFI